MVMRQLEERRVRDTKDNIGIVQKVKKGGVGKVELDKVWLIN
jgi:hypothetical protein